MGKFLIISAIALLFLAPYYWVFAVVTWFVLCAITGTLLGENADFPIVVITVAFVVIGWVWVLSKLVYRIKTKIPSRLVQLGQALEARYSHGEWRFTSDVGYTLASVECKAGIACDFQKLWRKVTHNEADYVGGPRWGAFLANLRVSSRKDLGGESFWVPLLLRDLNGGPEAERSFRTFLVEALNWGVSDPADREKALSLYDAAVNQHRQEGARTSEARDERRDPSAQGRFESIENYCQIFGLSPEFTMQELQAAYREKVKQWHPDKLDGMASELKEHANRELARINEAYQRLKDLARRNAGTATRHA